MTAEARYIISEMSDFDECRECYKPEPVEEGMACVGFCGKDRRHFTCQVLTQHYKYFRARVGVCQLPCTFTFTGRSWRSSSSEGV